MYRKLSTIALLLALGGCAATSNANAPPPDAKAIVLANKGRIFKDPDSVKSTSITAPFQNQLFSFSWLVCVRSNARNSFGGYTGESDSLIAIQGASLEVLHEKAPDTGS